MGQTGTHQHLAAVNRRLRLPIVHAGPNSRLPKPFRGAMLASKRPGIWRMLVR